MVWSVTVGVLALVVIAEVLLVRAACTLAMGHAGHSVAVLGMLLSVGVFAAIARFSPGGYMVHRADRFLEAMQKNMQGPYLTPRHG